MYIIEKYQLWNLDHFFSEIPLFATVVGQPEISLRGNLAVTLSVWQF